MQKCAENWAVKSSFNAVILIKCYNAKLLNNLSSLFTANIQILFDTCILWFKRQLRQLRLGGVCEHVLLIALEVCLRLLQILIEILIKFQLEILKICLPVKLINFDMKLREEFKNFEVTISQYSLKFKTK